MSRRKSLRCKQAQHELAPLYACKRQVVQRKAMNKYKADEAAAFDGDAMRAELEARLGAPLEGLPGELAFARAVGVWSTDETAHSADIELALRYAAWAAHTPAGKARHRTGVLFKAPRKLDYLRLIPVEHEHKHGIDSFRLPDDHLRRRDGFALTDAGTDLAGGLDQANYCIWCHEQQKDSCSSGLREKKTPDGAPPPFKRSPFGVPLAGCPLEERISEFHKLRAEGWALGALAMICIDNPMVAGDRSSHLQRLHEVVHLPEAGAGRHPAIRDARAEGRAGAAVGLRDLRPADAMESARPRGVRCRGRPPASACSSSAWGRPASRWRITC